ncbi:hypothetical protein, partial [Dialister hominis]|uniref:hypothetical protein n=1 Tax=Dialister hominis TaxID=2582419 RepID=UPI003AB68E72
QLGSGRKSDKKFYKKFKKYQKIKIGACSCVAGLLLPEQGKRQFFPPSGAGQNLPLRHVPLLSLSKVNAQE